jgi:hypothetical protein
MKHLEIYDRCMVLAAEANAAYTKAHGPFPSSRLWGASHPPCPGTTDWIHLADAVERGTISPLEAYDTIRLGYVAMHLRTRESRYNQLLV